MFKGEKVTFDESYLHVELQDGRVISTPMDWYPKLKNSTLHQMKNYRFICRNTGIEWKGMDYQLSIESMVLGNTASKSKVA